MLIYEFGSAFDILSFASSVLWSISESSFKMKFSVVSFFLRHLYLSCHNRFLIYVYKFNLNYITSAHLVFEMVLASMLPWSALFFITTPITFNLNFIFSIITFHDFAVLLSFLSNSLFLLPNL